MSAILSLLAALKAASGGGGAPTPTLVASTTFFGVTNPSSSAIDTTGATFLVVALGEYATSGVVSDNKGNYWVPLTRYGTTSVVHTRMWVCYSPIVGTGHTFTVTGNSVYDGAVVGAFSGVTNNPLDSENGSTGGSWTTRQAGIVTPVGANNLVLASLGHDQNSGAAISIGDSYSIIGSIPWNNPTNMGTSLAWKANTSGAQNPTWTTASSSVAGASAIATFTPVASGDVSFVTPNSNTTSSINLTLPSALTNGAIVLIGRFEPAGGNPSATFDGTPMTWLGGVGIGGRNVYALGLAVGNKAAGTYTTALTISTYGIQITYVMALNNVNQSTPFGTLVQQSTGGVSSMTLNPASAVGDMAIALSTIQGQVPHATAPFGTGQAPLFAAGDGWGWSASRKAGAASTTSMIHYPAAAAMGMAMIAFAVKKA